MFNDKYGLTASVLNGKKTMTRRIVSYTGVAYKVGEIVAVAQNYQDALNEFNRCGDKAGWAKLIANTDNGCAGYRNKMFVRADLMPHRIRITDVRVEQLRDITDEECFKEGIVKVYDPDIIYVDDAYTYAGSAMDYVSPRTAFASLIDKVSGRGTWASNTLVFVYTFELID